jgi:hypothetical protein
VTAPQYVHPDSFLSPKQRFRRRLWLALACLGAVGIGAATLVPPSATKSDAAIAPRDPVSRAETVPTASPVGYAAVDPQIASEHGAQVIVAFQLPKVRMVRVPRAASVGQQGNSAKPGVAAAPRSPGLDKETSEAKKTQRSAHRQNQRSTSARREARVADWTARGYGRSDYGRQGFSRNFW